MVALFFYSVISLPQNPSLFANTNMDYDNKDIRELCRMRIAGHYLKTVSSVERLAGYVVSLKTKLTTLEKSERENRGKLEKLRLLREKNLYDYDVERTYRSQKDLYDLLQKRITNDTKTLQKVQTSLKEAVQKRDTFKKKLLKVFTIKKNPDSKGYDIKVDYKHTCHEFDFLCPLPKNQALQLKKILAKKTPEPCLRYSQREPMQPPEENPY